MKKEQSIRFSDAPWMKENNEEIKICQIGVGGIGSWLALFLSRIGFSLTIFDDDKVSEENIGGQFYTEDNIGDLKVDAVSELIEAFTGHTPKKQKKRINLEDPKEHLFPLAYNIFFDRPKYNWNTDKTYKTTTPVTVLIASPDNMKARTTAFNIYKVLINRKNSPDHIIYVDGRMEAETGQIFCVYDAKTAKRYENEALFDDKEVPDLQCSYRATTHNAAIIAGLMTTYITNYITNVYEGEELREVPFKTNYILPAAIINVDRHESGGNTYKIHEEELAATSS